MIIFEPNKNIRLFKKNSNNLSCLRAKIYFISYKDYRHLLEYKQMMANLENQNDMQNFLSYQVIIWSNLTMCTS